jgi:hypothetical protein
VNRRREPVALIEASALGVAGVIAALIGPWPWLAAVAGPLIFLVVLVIATWRGLPRKTAPPEQNVAALVHRWANQLADDHPAHAHADQATQLVDEVADLILRCERGIAQLDGPARDKATESLGRITNFVATSVNIYTSADTAPGRAPEWITLAKRLQDARKNLQEDLARL